MDAAELASGPAAEREAELDEAELAAGVPRTPSKHLAVFIYALTGGGAQRRTVTLANGFAAAGHRVDLVVVRSLDGLVRDLSPRVRLVPLDEDGRGLHVRIRRLTSQRGPITALAVPALARYLRREHPDALLSAASHVNLVAVAAWRLARTPLALVLRASNHPTGNVEAFPPLQRLIRLYLRWLARRFYPRADAIVAVSEGVARELARATGIPRARIEVVHNPVVTRTLRRRMEAPLDHPWLASGALPVILAAGRMTLQKDFPTLIHAFRRLRARRPARLVVLGDGPGRPALEALVARFELGADVLLPGHVDNPLPWMRRAALFVLSSRWEGLPGVLIKALACGCPVVATDCPSGPSEILEGGRFGRLVPVGDARALARAMAEALDAPVDRARLAAAAERFTPQAAIARYLEVLEACIRRRAPERLARRPFWPLTVPLAWTSEEGLGHALGRAGLERVDLLRPFPGNAAHRHLMARMLERQGVEPVRAVARAWPELVAADRRCFECRAVRRCRDWLARPADPGEARTFCPNAELFIRLRGSAC